MLKLLSEPGIIDKTRFLIKAGRHTYKVELVDVLCKKNKLNHGKSHLSCIISYLISSIKLLKQYKSLITLIFNQQSKNEKEVFTNFNRGLTSF